MKRSVHTVPYGGSKDTIVIVCISLKLEHKNEFTNRDYVYNKCEWIKLLLEFQTMILRIEVCLHIRNNRWSPLSLYSICECTLVQQWWKSKTLKPFFSFWQNVKCLSFGRNLMKWSFSHANKNLGDCTTRKNPFFNLCDAHQP